MVGAFVVWLIVSAPVAMLIGAWGAVLLQRRHAAGRLLLSWAVAAPFGPPLLTWLTWLAKGNSTPEPRSGFEPWPYTSSVALLSLGLASIGTPILLGFVWLWVSATFEPETDSQAGSE